MYSNKDQLQLPPLSQPTNASNDLMQHVSCCPLYESAMILCMAVAPAAAHLLLLACAEGMPGPELAGLSKGPLLLEAMVCLGSVT